MSGTKTKAPAPKNSNRPGIFNHIDQVVAAAQKQLKKKVGAIIAMLYIRGDNGKMSGRASGNVYMRNGRIRGFVVPRLVRTSYTATARTLLALFSQAWSGLTDGQREGWNEVTDAFKTDRFGNPIPIKGKALFVERNTNLLNVAQPTLTDYQLPQPVPGITTLTPHAAQTAGLLTGLTIDFTPTPVDSTVSIKVFATPPLGAGIARPKQSLYRFFHVMAPGATTGENLLSDYLARFSNSAPAGSKIFIQCVPVNINTGQAGVIIQAVGVVA